MHGVTILITAFAIAKTLANSAPAQTPAPSLRDAVIKRANSCTFSGSDGYSAASVSKTSCSTIVLSALTVPGGETLDLENLTNGTTVSQGF